MYRVIIKYLLKSLFFSLTTIVFWQQPGLSAEKIHFYYGLLEVSIKVEDLKLFQQEGNITRQLAHSLQFLSEKEQQKLREVLRIKHKVDPVLVYRFSHTSVGKKLIRRLGDIIQIPNDINGFYGIRGALIQAANDDNGISLVSFLESFPTDIKINIKDLLELDHQISNSQAEIKQFLSQIENQEETTYQAINSVSFPDLISTGQEQVSQKVLNLYDSSRNRKLHVDLYLPVKSEDTREIFVLIISNGLGAKKERYQNLAEYLASHGFAVVIPNHPGSDKKRQEEFLAGLHRDNFDSTEFIERPQDISYIIDELEKINQNQELSQLNLKQVGVLGYSFGGTTALALGGAKINFNKLDQDCQENLDLLNISILYQCRALEIQRRNLDLKDPRVSTIFVFVPFANSIYGPEELNKITLPIMWQAVDQDFLTAFKTEQLQSFSALSAENKYLVVTENLPHTAILLPKDLKLRNEIKQLSTTYQSVLALIFFQAHLMGNKEYLPYLSSDYLKILAQEPYNLYLYTDQESEFSN